MRYKLDSFIELDQADLNVLKSGGSIKCGMIDVRFQFSLHSEVCDKVVKFTDRTGRQPNFVFIPESRYEDIDDFVVFSYSGNEILIT